MNPERWQQIKKIYLSALDLLPGKRQTFLREACAGDESLLQEVRSLLAQEPGGLLDSPALDAAARALAEEEGAKQLPELIGQALQHYSVQRKIGEGGFRGVTIYLETVDWETSMPSLSSSPCTRGAPHVGSEMHILRMSSLISRPV